MRIYILRRTKNATQNFQAPQERYNKLFLHKKIWGCGCTCMHSTQKGHMTSKLVQHVAFVQASSIHM